MVVAWSFGGPWLALRAKKWTFALELTQESHPFLQIFLDEARDVTQPSIEQVRLRQVERLRADSLTEDAQVGMLWNEAAAYLEDDEKQQAFIQACLKTQQLEYAVRCYRALKLEKPNDVLIDRYLHQVGTILGFYALNKTDAATTADNKMPTSVKAGMALFLVAALALAVMALFR